MATKKSTATKKDVPPTAKAFISLLTDLSDPAKIDNSKHFSDPVKGNKFLHVRMGHIFDLAKACKTMVLTDVSKMLDSAWYEVRVAAVCIMDFQAREKKITPEHRKALYDLYVKKHDRINNWDMVDRSAPFVVGGYLFDKPRKVLYTLAKSKHTWERRTAIVSTYYFIRNKQLDDTFAIARLLVHDAHDLINKAVGSWVREAGKQDKRKLLAFLDEFAKTMPRVTLRYALEKQDKKTKDHYMAMAKG
ncbi:MAG: DNA alkylation repair protein [Bacteroidia bacterium]|nr:DNA alkylation repair protein [Bacteroidia bacterium]